MDRNTAGETGVTCPSMVYEDGRYILLSPDRMWKRETLPVLPSGQPWTVVHAEKGYAAASSDGRPLPGLTELGEYQVVEFLAAGGSSLCYKAVHKGTGHIAVLKEFYPYSLANRGLVYRGGLCIREAPGLTLRDKRRIRTAEKNFDSELLAADQLRYREDVAGGVTNDPRFLAVTKVMPDVGDSALNRYHAIDTHAGTFLDKLSFSGEGRERVLDELSLVKQVLIALRALHRHKAPRAHLDLKPENILVSYVHVNDGDRPGNHPVILLDFGSSLPIDERGIIKTGGADVFLTSTRGYAAPELINCDYDRIGIRSDIYSAFVILQQLLLSDVEEGGEDLPLSLYERIRQSRSVRVLTENEQKLLAEFLSRGLSRRDIDTAEAFLQELDTAIDVLRCCGVHPAILRASAEGFSKAFSRREAVSPEPIYEVVIE